MKSWPGYRETFLGSVPDLTATSGLSNRGDHEVVGRRRAGTWGDPAGVASEGAIHVAAEVSLQAEDQGSEEHVAGCCLVDASRGAGEQLPLSVQSGASHMRRCRLPGEGCAHTPCRTDLVR